MNRELDSFRDRLTVEGEAMEYVRWWPVPEPPNMSAGEIEAGLREQADLFKGAAAADPVPDTPLTHRERFEAFHAANPAVYGELVRLARDLMRRGHRRYSIGGLFEVLRYRRALQTRGDAFKLNNNFRAFYARLIMEREEDLDGFFEKRQQRSADRGA